MLELELELPLYTVIVNDASEIVEGVKNIDCVEVAFIFKEVDPLE
jgi:hypothetical protein